MFVIDRVELGSIDQVLHIWSLYYHDPAGCQQSSKAVHYPVQVRYVREHIVRMNNVSAFPVIGEAFRSAGFYQRARSKHDCKLEKLTAKSPEDARRHVVEVLADDVQHGLSAAWFKSDGIAN